MKLIYSLLQGGNLYPHDQQKNNISGVNFFNILSRLQEECA